MSAPGRGAPRSRPSTAILVVSYGSAELVDLNLSRTRLPPEAMVIVVDNYTTSAERERVRGLADERGWRLLTPDSNLGFGQGMNLAAAEAVACGVEVLIPLNPDASIRGDGVLRLRDRVLRDRLLQVSPLVERPDGRHFSSLMEVSLRDGALRRSVGERRLSGSVPWVSGACFAVSAELWVRTGGFDDDYFLYWEDVDFSIRVLNAGGRVELDETVVAVHDPGGTQTGDGDSKSPTYFFYNARNRLVFAAKHGRPEDRARWLLGSVPALRNVLIRGGRRHLLHPRSSIVPALRGVWEGYRFFLETTRRDEKRS